MVQQATPADGAAGAASPDTADRADPIDTGEAATGKAAAEGAPRAPEAPGTPGRVEAGEGPEAPGAVLEAIRLTLSVVVCAYTEDRWDDIRGAVNSLRGQYLPPDQILLVVDYNEALRRRAAAELRGVEILANAEQKGLSGARNTGLAAATGDVVAFVDDDAAAERDWTVRLLTAYQDPDVMAVGGRIVPAWAAGRPDWFPPEFDWVVGCTYTGMPQEAAPVRNVIGANMSFRRELLGELGGFIHGLGRIGNRPLGCEETELCIRAGEHHPDRVILYQPAAAVHHHVPAVRGTWGYFRARCWNEGLSKAAVSRMRGPQQALASERAYLRRAIPRAIGQALRPGPERRALSTVPAVAAGVAITAAGYLTGRLRPVHYSGEAGARASGGGGANAGGGLKSGGARNPGTGPPRPSAAGRPAGKTAGAGAGAAHPAAPHGGESGPGAPPRGPLVPALLLALLGTAVTLWLLALPRTNIDNLGGFGLTDRLPVLFWTSLVLLCTGFVISLHHPRRHLGWPIAYTVALIAFERATSALVYPTLLYSWAWKHVDIIDRLAANGGHLQLNNSLGEMSAYDQWAGFFSANTALVKLLGVHDALSYARWAPLISSLLLLAPLVLIYRVFSRDRRLVWTAVWIFYLGNWVGQDYFSPQAYAFVLYLGVLAVVFRRMARPARLGKHHAGDSVHPLTAPTPPPQDRRTRWLWTLLLLVPIAAISAAHQLTPLMLGAGLAGVSLTRRYRNWPLAVIALAFPVVWDSTVALPFVSINIKQIIQDFGDLMANSSATTGATPTGTGQIVVSYLDRGLSAGVAVLAVAGALRHPALRRTALPLMLIGATALPMLVANNYGGEMIFRVFLFTLPALAFFGAAALQPRPHQVQLPTPVGQGSRFALPAARPSLRAAAMILPALLVLGGAFVPSYFGKDALNYYPPGEIQLVQKLWRIAPTGAYIVAGDSDFPDANRRYATSPHYWIDEDTPAAVKQLMADPQKQLAHDFAWVDPKTGGYLIITRSQYNDAELAGLLPAGGLKRIERAAESSPRFRVVARNQYGVVFRYVPPSTAPAKPKGVR
ncbi:glycosyltransferase family 2 protein [Phaeacidiphilus oryzae]|uniref:glycosyltransferase family 2 protein n=1 Tax=Phaeacidiphilus oryzae TaxID=348818 RepID=UPI001F1DFFB2|nr:glycosyltransferase family 2 protein [Phaeacidiphilus oryzae]